MPITLNGSTGVTYPDGVLQGSGVPTASATSGAPLVSNGTIYTQSTAVAVAFGGTGATTLTGVLKGNGTSAFSAATAGTDFVAPGGALGTPSSGTLTNCTGYSASNLASGTLPSARLPSGTILQVVSTTKTDTWSETTSGAGGVTNDVTGFTATITPRSSSSRILILIQTSFSSSNMGHNINTNLYRNGSQIALADANGVQLRATTGQGQANQSTENMTNSNVNFVDSPATASSITYSIRFSTGLAGSNTVYLNRSAGDGQLTWIARGTSTITVMEIAG
jgi:hypothetical protein